MLERTSVINIKLEIVYKTVNEKGERIAKDMLVTPEIILNAPVELTKDGNIIIAYITTVLKTMGYKLDNAEVWFYSTDYKDYVYCGREPISRVVLAQQTDLENNCIRLKVRVDKISLLGMEESKSKEGKNNTKAKERELAVIIRKVKKWRDLYRGYQGKDGRRINYSLDDAAKMVNLPKKTLDDYLQQLKQGKKYGFDFHDNQHKKIGVLRDFINEKNKELKDLIQVEDNSMNNIEF